MRGLLRTRTVAPTRRSASRSRSAAAALPEWLWAALLYLSLAAGLLWPALVYGQVPLPLMNAFAQGDPFWSSAAPGDVGAGANRLLGDVSGFYYPYVVFAVERLRAGDIPLWNPYTF